MKPFIFWDGEGVKQFICSPDGTIEIDYPYVLFGASTGERIKYVNLSTIDCLDLIIKVGEAHDGIHVSFVFGYDVNMIAKDLDERALHVLRTTGKCYFEGYIIEHIPRKWLHISRGRSNVRIYDTFLFFNCPFGKALRKYAIGSAEDLDRIDKGKAERPNFTWADIAIIERYWEVEGQLGVELCTKLRDIIYGAGFRITSWHGPGALASYALREHNTQLYMNRAPPDEIIECARYAMFGGRFNNFLAGFYDGKVYERDINSAYAYAFSRLPSLATGKWRYDPYPDKEQSTRIRLGFYHIRYMAPLSRNPMPLPHREKDGHVLFPNVTEGWFHASEAALVRNDPNAEWMEAWIFEDDGSYPFSWILDAFQERLELQRKGDPTEKTLKWMLAALYGQAAQRTGWEKWNGPPRWHQIEWAGAVTAECRAMVYTAAIRARESLVSIDTDGFIALAPVNILPNGIGEGLGEWKLTEYTGILYLQNGIYWLRDTEGNWLEPKSRGIPRRKLDFNVVYPLMLRNQNLQVSQHMFIGYGLALRGQMDKWRKWIDVPRDITFGGNGKSQHISRLCPACQRGLSWGEGMHQVTMRPPDEIQSHPYDLPWLAENEVRELERHTSV